jgi:hypothetical protein
MNIVILNKMDLAIGLCMLACALLIAGILLWYSLQGAYIFAILMPLFLLMGVPVCITLSVLGYGVLKDSMEIVK